MKPLTTPPANPFQRLRVSFAVQWLYLLVILFLLTESFVKHAVWMSVVELILVGVMLMLTLVQGIALMLVLRAGNPSQQHQQILAHELDHRVKNNLATVLSLAKQSVAKAASPEQFYQDFLGRIQALSNAHSALARTHWKGVDMLELTRLALEPYMNDDSNRVTIAGPALLLPADAAGPLSMSLHELATNAAKFGGLSNAAGRVDVRWTVDASPRVVLTWSEFGGPLVTPPTRTGMGLDLIRGFISYELEGEVQIDFPPTGLVCVMKFNLPASSNPNQFSP